VTYDRRGRGASGEAGPWSLEREVEDLAALIEAVGGRASLLGFSSGGALALEAAARLASVERVIAYEIPFVLDPSGNVMPDGFIEQIEAHVAAGRPGDAARQFMLHVGTPRPAVAVMRLLPMWKGLAAAARTLPHDLRLLGDTQHGRPLPRERFAAVGAPVLVVAGGRSPRWMRSSARATAETLPQAEHRELPGQTHMVKAEALAPAVTEFLGRPAAALATAGAAQPGAVAV
jgi:pimeloyl-ACP methyl ester carboxylesterase